MLSPKISVHRENSKLVVMITLDVSFLADNTWNSSSALGLEKVRYDNSSRIRR